MGQRFRKADDDGKDRAAAEVRCLEMSGPEPKNMQSDKDKDTETMEEIQAIVNSSKILGTSRTLQHISTAVRQETVNTILMPAGPSVTASTVQSSNARKDPTFDPGASSECMTHEEVIQRRRKKKAEALPAEVGKQRRKAQQEAERVVRLEAEFVRRHKQLEKQARKRQAREESVQLKRILAEIQHQKRAEMVRRSD